jgi:ABC-type sulfate transport system permease subunit
VFSLCIIPALIVVITARLLTLSGSVTRLIAIETRAYVVVSCVVVLLALLITVVVGVCTCWCVDLLYQ